MFVIIIHRLNCVASGEKEQVVSPSPNSIYIYLN